MTAADEGVRRRRRCAGHPVGGPPGRVERRRLALEPQPDHPARPAPALEQHLQLGGRARSATASPACSASTTRARAMNLHAGRSADGDRLGDRPRADRVRAGRRARRRDPGAVRARLRPARHLARGSLLRDLVQRLPRPDDRRRATRTTSRRSTSSTTPSCRSTATACSSRAGSAAATRCSAARATTATRRSATSSTPRAPTSSTGAGTGT